MDKISVFTKIMEIYNDSSHPSEQETVALIDALGKIGNDLAINKIESIYNNSKKSLPIKIAIYAALSNCIE